MNGPFGRFWRSAALVGLTALAACNQGSDDASIEVAAELRALRLTLQQARPAPAVEKGQFAEALAPLRDVLDRLVAEQKELHTRQLTLTEELQRWSQLLAQQVTGQSRADSEALLARLQQLEAALQAQDARHREVENLLGGALDRTADRLEDFLQRLPARPGQPGGGAAETKPPDGKVEGGVGAPVRESKPDEPKPPESKVGRTDAGARARRQAANAWWIAVLSAATLVGLGFAWRLRRSAAAEFRNREPMPGPDRGVDEIWAAAAMLGEAVGRLRDTANAQAGEPEPQPGPGDETIDDDVFVIDDDPVEEAADDAATAAPTSAVVVAAPTAVSLHVRAADPLRALAAVQMALVEDPRVLRRPAPAVTVRGDGVDVRFSVLPTLPAGQRAHVEQRVRDAAC
jgi:hypothetical protein